MSFTLFSCFPFLYVKGVIDEPDTVFTRYSMSHDNTNSNLDFYLSVDESNFDFKKRFKIKWWNSSLQFSLCFDRMQSNPEGLNYDEHLSKHKGFNNPRNIDTLTDMLGIDTTAPCSLLRSFQRYPGVTYIECWDQC